MKKHLPLLLVGCILLGGCSNVNTQDPLNIGGNSSQTVSAENVSNINAARDSENVKFKYEKPQTEQKPVGIYNYAAAEISQDSFLKLFSGEPTCEKETFPIGFRDEYSCADEEGVIMNRNGLLSVDYNTAQGFNCFVIAHGEEDPDRNTEFDFISRNEIAEKLTETVKNLLGIDIRITIDAVTAERFSRDAAEYVKALAELNDNPPNVEKYGTPADYYSVSITQVIEGIPIDGMTGAAVFTAAGMEYLSFYAPMKVLEKVGGGDSLIDLDGAEQLLKNKYDMLFLDSPVEVTSGELTYIVNESKLTPVWKFNFFGGLTEYYDAYTGKEIAVYAAGEGA
ncbi:MAG: hypothetical protein NC299_15865 [Lachnospiraceae bacterium]|nr:hypothetical protein [Ruminococcus sp.]MCM1276811.1 hypothetical protein [Lachnospiraceae bacterium]